jgi:DNA-directed RNA polymerase specialized sigma24 family protein
MKPDRQPAGNPPPSTKADKDYATPEEVEQAVKSLTDADHVKLMMIARSFCNRRKLAMSVVEPEELLSEAIVKTCLMDKKWNKAISIVRHLDRAMENISGHLVGERTKIIAFPDGLAPADDEGQAQEDRGGTGKATEIVNAVFGDDKEARQVFLMRVEEVPISQILKKLDLTPSQYETITRRIRRRISKFLAQTK